MVLLDSNIVIYSTQVEPEYDVLREYLLAHPHCVSLITYVEVLGYHVISEEDLTELRIFFDSTPVLSITTKVAERAVWLRQKRNMKLGDAFIAATALENRLKLVTKNTEDFKWIDSLNLTGPLENG